MSRALAAGLAAIVILAAGCGGSGSSSAPQGKQEQAVAQTWTTYVESVKGGDGKTACQQLTPTFQRQAAQLVTPKDRAKLKGAACPQAVEQGTIRVAFRNYHPSLERITIKGDRAKGFQPGEGALGPENVLFRRLGGEWKIFATVYQKGGPQFGA
jgi:hypothetical protein